MAVIMTTKFYEEHTPAWHDLSKIVFTSPNIDSPNTAGTRSHILPGSGDLALWYEDVDNVYEIEPVQDTSNTSLYYYHFDVGSTVDLDNNPTSAIITAGNYPQFVNFIRRELGVEEVGFISINSNIIDETVKLEYTLLHLLDVPYSAIECIYLNRTTTYNKDTDDPADERHILVTHKRGWHVGVLPDVIECYVKFEFFEPTMVTAIKIEPQYTYTHVTGFYSWFFIGNFKIQGKTTTVGASWVDLYTGSNTSNVDKYIFMTNNVDYYTYYRILILNNDSLIDFPEEEVQHSWDKEVYAISGLIFYTYEYSTDPGSGHVVLYSFDDDISKKELHVVNATPVAGYPIGTEYDVNTNVEGVINVSNFLDGSVLTSSYTIDVNEVGASTDYYTQASGNSVLPVVSGTTGATGTIGTTTIFQDLGVLPNEAMVVVGETKIEGGYIYSDLSGQQHGLTYSDYEYDITTDITYTTTVSGQITDGYTGDVVVTGYTNRYEDRNSAPRSEFYDISLSDTVGTGTMVSGTTLYLWEQKPALLDVEFSTHDSVVFNLTLGEAYDCRLTAWDDVTHSTTLNYLISGDYVRVSALAFRSKGTILEPEFSTSPNNYIASPVYNRIFKGDVVYNGVNYYYGDFDLSYRTEPDMIGDYLIFKPMLYEIDDSVSYGIHDHVIVLHYTYT